MSLHLFSGPGRPYAACAEAGHGAVWTMAFNPPSIIRRPATIRADLPTPHAEGQTEKRWRGVPMP